MNKIVLALDSHQLSMYQTCPRKFQLGAVRSLESTRKRTALGKGTLMHELLAKYYTYLKTQESNWKHYNEELAHDVINDDTLGLELPDRLMVAKRFVQHCEHYHNNNGEFVPALVEGADETGFSKLLYEDDKHVFVYEGRIDLIHVYPVGGYLVWADHKTQNPKYAFPLYEKVNQFIGYSWALECVVGVINYITFSEKITDRTFRRHIATYTRDFLEKWRTQTIKTYFDIVQSLKAVDYDYRFNACETKYGACTFHNVCSATNKRAEDWIIGNDFKKRERWRAW